MNDPAARYAALFARRAAKPVAALFRAGAASPQEVIPLTYGFPDPGSFPYDDLVAASGRVLDDGGDTALQYGPIAGDERFRDHVAERLRDDGLAVSADNIIVTSGGSQGIQLVTELVVDPGDAVIVEAPSFIGALQTFRNAEAELYEVPLDDHGMQTDKLAEVLAKLSAAGKQPKLIYTIPTFHNPAGVSMPLERRHELIELARQYGVLVLEDDAYSELRFDGERAPFLYELEPEGLVIQVRTYSKILAAGLRLGYLVAPEALIPRLLPLKVDVGTSPFLSRLAVEFAADGRLAAHIERLRGLYRERRDAMLAALDEYVPPPTTWTRPEGGFFVWLRLPEGLDAGALLPRAEEAGVSFIPGTANFTHGDGSRYLRLTFSFLPPDRLTAGIQRLGRAIQAALADSETHAHSAGASPRSAASGRRPTTCCGAAAGGKA